MFQHHPDVHNNDASKHAKIVEINAAFDVLGDEHKRSKYDEEMGFKRSVEPKYDPFPPSYHGRPENFYSNRVRFAGRRTTVGGPQRPKWKNSYSNGEELHERYREAMRLHGIVFDLSFISRDEKYYSTICFFNRRDEEEWQRRREELDEFLRRRNEATRAFAEEQAREREKYHKEKVFKMGFGVLLIMFSINAFLKIE